MLSDGTCLSFVAESTIEGLCAHATARIDYCHPILEVPEAELIDNFILPSWSGYGIGQELTTRLLSAFLQHGLRFVRSTIVVENTPPERVEQVSTWLTRTGWYLNTRLMYLVLIQ